MRSRQRTHQQEDGGLTVGRKLRTAKIKMRLSNNGVSLIIFCFIIPSLFRRRSRSLLHFLNGRFIIHLICIL